LLLGRVEERRQILRRFADCFRDYRNPARIEHTVEELVAQRVYAIALGYEDVNDHDTLRFDPLLASLVGKSVPKGAQRSRGRDQGKGLAAGSSWRIPSSLRAIATSESRLRATRSTTSS